MNVLVESFLETQLNIKLSNSKKKKNCFALPSQISKYKNDSFSRNTNIVTRMVQSDAFYTFLKNGKQQNKNNTRRSPAITPKVKSQLSNNLHEK